MEDSRISCIKLPLCTQHLSKCTAYPDNLNFLSANPPLFIFKKCNIDEDVVDADDWDEIQQKTLSGGGRRTANRSYPRVIRHTTSLNSFCICFLDDGSCWRIGSPGGIPPNLRSQTDCRFNCLTIFFLRAMEAHFSLPHFLDFFRISADGPTTNVVAERNGSASGSRCCWSLDLVHGDFSPLYQVNGTYTVVFVFFEPREATQIHVVPLNMRSNVGAKIIVVAMGGEWFTLQNLCQSGFRTIHVTEHGFWSPDHHPSKNDWRSDPATCWHRVPGKPASPEHDNWQQLWPPTKKND